jgi:putative hydrolase of the HAD superfamily
VSGSHGRLPLKVVFFDLDDTLCDTIGSRPERARKAFERLCGEYPHLDADQLVERAVAQMQEPRWARGILPLLEELGLAQTAAGTDALRIFLTHFGPIRLFPDVEQTLIQLGKKYALGVISNAQEWYQRAKLVHLGLEPRIRYFVVSDSVGYEKPDPRIFRHALALAGVQPDEAVFVGDRLDIDVAGAKAVSMRAVWLNRSGDAIPDGVPRPDWVVRHFHELPVVLA